MLANSKVVTTAEIEIAPKPFDAERMKGLVERVMQTHIERELARAQVLAAQEELESAKSAHAIAKADIDGEVARVCGVDRYKL